MLYTFSFGYIRSHFSLIPSKKTSWRDYMLWKSLTAHSRTPKWEGIDLCFGGGYTSDCSMQGRWARIRILSEATQQETSTTMWHAKQLCCTNSPPEWIKLSTAPSPDLLYGILLRPCVAPSRRLPPPTHNIKVYYPSSLSSRVSSLSPLIYLRVLPRFLLIPSIALSHIFWIFYSFLSLQSLYTCLARVCVAVCIRKLFIGRTHDLMPRTHGHLIFLYASIDCVKAMSARSVSSSRATCFPFSFFFSFVSFFSAGLCTNDVHISHVFLSLP